MFQFHLLCRKRHNNPRVITRCASCGTVYCNRSCLFVGGYVCVCVWICYHDNSKLHASIFTKLGL